MGCTTNCTMHIKIEKFETKIKVFCYGNGCIGYSCLFVLNYLGIKDITCIDSNPARLKYIRYFKGTSPFLNQKNKKFTKSNYEKFDLIIDCSGSKNLI